MASSEKTPPQGQKFIQRFERFGLPTFAFYQPPQNPSWQLEVSGLGAKQIDIFDALRALPRRRQSTDFHCVTGWSVSDVDWGGYAFADVYRQLIEPLLPEGTKPGVVIFRGDDRYVTSLPLEDALAEGVMLADEQSGSALNFDHGAPLRLVAPAHYGYKNVKHLRAIELASDESAYRFRKPWPRAMEHPRGRVAQQERGRYLPAWLFLLIYRPIVWPTRQLIRMAGRRRQ